MLRALLVRLGVLPAIALLASAQSLVRSLPGFSAGAQLGRSMVRIPDQNADGVDDVLVGAPGFNSNRGAIYCISGNYLATGGGLVTLWFLEPLLNPGDRFGASLAVAGDVNGDGLADFVVGAPGHDLPGQTDIGALRTVSGATHAVVGTISGFEPGGAFGASVARIGDLTGDGKAEIVCGSPGPNCNLSRVAVLKGTSLTGGSNAVTASLGLFQAAASDQAGFSVAGGFDLNGDGSNDFAFGLPGRDSLAGPLDVGAVSIYEFTAANFGPIGGYVSSVAGERLGSALAAGQDFDNDGVGDLVVGAPNFPVGVGTEVGRALVLSGQALAAHSSTPELYTLNASSSGPLPIAMHFGASVRASDDLTGDGVGEILVGAPDFGTTLPFGPGKGSVTIYSGATGARIGGLVGSNNDRLGDGLAGALEDLDGDGFSEFVVGGSLSDAAGADSGVVKCYRLFPCFPSSYCTGKTNSLGCVPAISSNGVPSQFGGAPFLISATNFLNQKNGLLFYSHRPLAAPFQGGTKCAQNPTVRTPVQSSGGSSAGSDCTGAYSFDFNAWIVTGSDPSLTAGVEVFAQYWSRDPASASQTGLSNALRFLINP